MDILIYEDLFRFFATNHVDILHVDDDPKQKHFIRVLLSSDPVQREIDLSDFYNTVPSLPAGAFLVLFSFEDQLADNKSDNFRTNLMGRFLIMDKAARAKDPDARAQTLHRCQVIANDCTAYLHQVLTVDPQIPNVIFPLDQVAGDFVGPVKDIYYGRGVNFIFNCSANQQLHYNADKYL